MELHSQGNTKLVPLSQDFLYETDSWAGFRSVFDNAVSWTGAVSSKKATATRIGAATWRLAAKIAYYYEDTYPTKFAYAGVVAPKDLSKSKVDLWIAVRSSDDGTMCWNVDSQPSRETFKVLFSVQGPIQAGIVPGLMP